MIEPKTPTVLVRLHPTTVKKATDLQGLLVQLYEQSNAPGNAHMMRTASRDHLFFALLCEAESNIKKDLKAK